MYAYMHYQLGGLKVNYSIAIMFCDYGNLRPGSILASLVQPCITPDNSSLQHTPTGCGNNCQDLLMNPGLSNYVQEPQTECFCNTSRTDRTVRK